MTAALLAPALIACRGGSRSGSTGTAKPSGASNKPIRGGTLTVRSFSDVSILDYAYNHDVYSDFVIGNCVETLLTHDDQAQPHGLLAMSWENPDDRTYVFKLRQGVKFQDGTDLNADAVEYSLNRVHTDKTAFRYPDLLYIDKIEKPDQATVKVTLTGPFAPFLEKLTSDAGCVISPAIAEKYGKDRLKLDLTGQGTGPFKFVEWKTDDHVALVRNEGYWGRDASDSALPYLDRVTVRVIPDDSSALAALRNGEIDGFRPNGTEGPPPKDTASVRADPSLAYKSIPGLGFSYVVFNEAKEPFSSKELRQAVSYAIDRDTIAKTVWFETVSPLDVVFAPSIWANDPGYHPYLKRDVGKAKQLLAQAGKANGFSFTYMTSAGDNNLQQTAELIKDQLKEAGIEMTIQLLEFARLTQALTAGEHQAGSIAWSASLDPDDWVYNHFSSRGSLIARSHYSNPEVDALLVQARTTLDAAKRKPIYQQAQRLIMDDAVYCLLYDRNMVAFSARSVQSYPLGPTPAVGVSQVWKTS